MLELALTFLLSEDGTAMQQALQIETESAPASAVLAAPSIPQKRANAVAPVLTDVPDASYFVVDELSGKTLYAKNETVPRPVASLTKLMTALVILDEHALHEVVQVPLLAAAAEGASIDLLPYEKVTVQMLLEAAIIPSANDAALALAMYNSETEAAFVQKMNAKAEELGLESAVFYNATGLDAVTDEGTKYNTMHAKDAYKLARHAMNNAFIASAAQSYGFVGDSVDGKFSHGKASTNQLLGSFLGVDGVKTGYTEAAGECLILRTNKDGNRLVTVILGSKDRFGVGKDLASWAHDSYEW